MKKIILSFIVVAILVTLAIFPSSAQYDSQDICNLLNRNDLSNEEKQKIQNAFENPNTRESIKDCIDIPSLSPPNLCPEGTIQECADLDGNNVTDDVCVWWQCVDGVCQGVSAEEPQGTPREFADVGSIDSCFPDTEIDLDDVFHVINCFSSNAQCEDDPPRGFRADIGGLTQCQPDGVCNLFDIFHVLNVFSGTSPCICLMPSETDTEISIATLQNTYQIGDDVNLTSGS